MQLYVVCIWIVATSDIGVYADIGSHIRAHDPISGFSCDPISGHVSCVPISGPIFRGLGPDIGCAPISGHHVTDIVYLVPDIGFNIGTNIGYPDIGVSKTRYRCQYRIQYRVTRYRGMIVSDIVVNIGHDIVTQ